MTRVFGVKFDERGKEEPMRFLDPGIAAAHDPVYALCRLEDEALRE